MEEIVHICLEGFTRHLTDDPGQEDVVGVAVQMPGSGGEVQVVLPEQQVNGVGVGEFLFIPGISLW